MLKIKTKNNPFKIFKNKNNKVQVQKENLQFKLEKLKSTTVELMEMTNHNFILKSKKIQRVHI